MLRKEPNGCSDGDVWLESEAEVETGQTVALLKTEKGFALIRTSDGDEGYVRAAYLHGASVSAFPYLALLPAVRMTSVAYPAVCGAEHEQRRSKRARR